MVGRALVYVMAASLLVGDVASVAAQTREAAVEAARRGEYDTAISSLRALVQAAPSDAGVRFDLAVVLQWAGRSREATDVFEGTRATEAPEYVLSAMTRAYRDQQRWADAARLAAEGSRRFPESAEWPLAARLAEAGAALEAGDSYAALRAYLAARLLAPDDDRLRREVSGILVQIGAPFAAGLHVAGRDPVIEAAPGRCARQPGHGDSRPGSRTSLRPDRRGARTPRVAARRRQGGLAAGRRARRPAARRPGPGVAGSRAVVDVVGEVAALRQEGRPIPPYIREAEADALLALRRPGRGARCLRRGPCRRAPVAFRARGTVLRAARRRAPERRTGPGRRDGGRGRAEDGARRVASAGGQRGLARRAGARGPRPLLRRRVP